ncbi:MAG: hypothetical protein ACKOW9_01080 [Candidatus Paceibacterota bacterium]
MFKNFIIRKMLRTQGVPAEQIDLFIKMMEKDPKLFEKIALEIQEKVKNGMDQMQAGKEVMQKYEADLKKLI